MSHFLKISLIVLALTTNYSFAAIEEKKDTSTTASVTTEVDTSSLDSLESKAKGYYATTKEKLELFRTKQATYFATLRDTTKVKLNIQLSSDVLDRLGPLLSPPPAPAGIPGTVENDGIEPKKMDNPVDYGKLILSTMLATFFANPLMFYGLFFLLILIFVRAIFKMFS